MQAGGENVRTNHWIVISPAVLGSNFFFLVIPNMKTCVARDGRIIERISREYADYAAWLQSVRRRSSVCETETHLYTFICKENTHTHTHTHTHTNIGGSIFNPIALCLLKQTALMRICSCYCSSFYWIRKCEKLLFLFVTNQNVNATISIPWSRLTKSIY